MSRRPANVTQADVARMIRAAQATGVRIVRIVASKDGVAIETEDAPTIAPEEPVDDEEVPVL